MNDHIKGAFRSKTIWLNFALTLLGGVAVMEPQLRTLIGPEWTAGILIAGAVANIVLRFQTTADLASKVK